MRAVGGSPGFSRGKGFKGFGLQPPGSFAAKSIQECGVLKYPRGLCLENARNSLRGLGLYLENALAQCRVGLLFDKPNICSGVYWIPVLWDVRFCHAPKRRRRSG